MWAVVVLSILAMSVLTRQVGFHDLGYHLRAAAWQWEHRALLDVDVFTSTFRGAEWVNQNWLAQLILYATYRATGLAGLSVLNAALFVTGAALILAVAARRARGDLRVAAIAFTAAGLPAIFNTSVRPQVFSWVLTALILWILERSPEERRLLYVLPPIFVVWANLHGAFVVGLALVAIDAVSGLAERRPRRGPGRDMMAVFAACCLAALANPWGWRVYAYAVDVGTDPTIKRFIEEWQGPDITSLVGALFFLSFAFVFGSIIFAARRVSLRDLLRLALGLLLALVAIRNGLWWSVVATPAVATALVHLPLAAGASHARSRAHLLVVAGLAVVVLLSLPWFRSFSPLVGSGERSLVSGDTPVETAAFLAGKRFAGNMFNAQEYGSYLEFAVPDHPTFVDARIEIFPDGLWDDYVDVMVAREWWPEVASRRGIGYIVVPNDRSAPFNRSLDRSPDWRLVHQDEVAVVFVRDTQES